MRFSLFSLTCFVLLVASAAALWWNWEAWEPAYTIRHELPIIAAGFSPDDRLIIAVCDIPGPRSNPNAIPSDTRTVYNIHESESGRLHHSHELTHNPNYNLHFSPSGKYVFINTVRYSAGSSDSGIWNAESGAPLPRPESMSNFSVDQISPRDNFALANFGENLVRLPSLERIAEFGTMNKSLYFPHENWIALTSAGQLKLLSTQSGKIEHAFPGSEYPFKEFSSAGDRIAIADPTVDAADEVTRLYDIATEKLIDHFLGRPIGQCLSPDGNYIATEVSSATNTVVKISEIGSKAPALEFGTLAPSTDTPRDDVRFHRNTVLLADPFKAVDLQTRAVLFDLGHCGDEVRYFSDDDHVYFRDVNKESALQIRETATGRKTFDLTALRWRRLILPPGANISASLAHRTPAFIIPGIPDKNSATVWHLVRPNLPWDALKMPEFWLTLFFAAALLWNFFRKPHPRQSG